MKQHKLFLSIGLVFGLQTGWAANTNFLKDAPIASFTAEDVALMEKNIQLSLESLPDGGKTAWKNDASGNSGLAQPIKSYEKDGKPCRSLRLINRSEKSINESTYEFCKEEGAWKLAM